MQVLSFAQAMDTAQAWFKRRLTDDSGEVTSGPYTVTQMMKDYLADREREKRKELSYMASTIDTHIIPALGALDVSKLTHSKVKAWRDALAEAAPLVRSKKGESPVSRTVEKDDADTKRKRHATANRIFTTFRAALNFAYKRGRIGTKGAWERIAPFRQVDAPKVRYLTVAECKRLIDACPDDFRRLVRAVLYTGCRYGELIVLPVGAFDLPSNKIHIADSKSGKSRFIALTDEGASFFSSVVADRDSEKPMFVHDEGPRAGKPWDHSQQRYWMEATCKDAGIAPAISFHILRHTYASQLAMNNAPMPVIAAQLGHADTRMTERHYAHLGSSYIADVVRANLPSFGFDADA